MLELIKKCPWQNKRSQLYIIITFLSLIITCFLFLILNRFNKLIFITFDFSTRTQVESEQCLINQCTIEQSKKHGDLFASFPPAWSGCYGDFYLSAFDFNDTSPVEVLIDVGANKAYAVSAWLAFFLPELGVNQARLGDYIQQTKHLGESCGSCNDCQDEVIQRKHLKLKNKLHIHAFEPQPGTVEILNDIKTWMNVSQRNDVNVQIHGMAVSDQTGKALFKRCNPGNEVCSLDISEASADSQIYVNITTLDDFTKQNSISKIDILKIDTESYDPLVYRGAKNLLEQHRIHLFISEHLKLAVWSNTSLEIEVSNLSKLGYVCYMIGKTGVIRITNCWNDRFNVRHNNILCVSSRDKRLLFNIDQMRVPETIATTC